MAKLILIRHGQSTWNAANRFSGWVDVPLNSVGRREAMKAAKKICQYEIDICFTSLLMRAKETTAICLTEGNGNCADKSPVFKHDADDPNWHGWDRYEGHIEEEIPIYTTPELDERYYGDLQGYNKAEMAKKVGEEIVHQWRRSFATRPPGGESLQDTAARTIPYFQKQIMPYLKAIFGAWSAYNVWEANPGTLSTWLLMGFYLLVEITISLYTLVMCKTRSLKVGMIIGGTGFFLGAILAGIVLSISTTAFWLLVPYLLWSPIGTFVTWQMMQLNPIDA